MLSPFIKMFKVICIALPLSACVSQSTKTVSNISSSGSYIDASGLTWTRCPLGMNWINSKCEGVANLYTIKEAKTIAKDFKASLPSLDQYQTLYKKDMRSLMPINCKGIERQMKEESVDFKTGKIESKTYTQVNFSDSESFFS